tara:strand:+ start:750 stop:1604 length:855 start_codon:yes stop_codon:yes gene_type:complete
MKKINKASIVYSSTRSTDKTLDEVLIEIENAGSRIESITSLGKIKNKKIKNKFSSSDLIIVIGGDGTMIGSIRELYTFGIPFVGINLGRVGFLTDIYPKKLFALKEVLKGKFLKEKRPIYKAFFSNKNQEIFINEVVIHSGSIAKMVDLELSSENEKIYNLNADGLIISTSTGSTAYSYSGGGPIVSPELNALSLLPMFSHSSSSHSLVMPNDKNLNVKIKSRKLTDPKVVVDGKKNLTYSKAGLEISNLKKYFYLLHPKDYNYYEACRTKLGWALPIDKLKND